VGGRIAALRTRLTTVIDLAGDVKRLKEFVPHYRLRVGDWRVLFDVRADAIIIHDIKHRLEAYDG